MTVLMLAALGATAGVWARGKKAEFASYIVDLSNVRVGE
jgi:hypothetical protein